MVTYEPRANGPNQAVRYAQGVGTLTEARPDQELFIYPTFKMQGPAKPTFTIGYANNSGGSADFSASRIKAYFRGAEVPIYTYAERIEEIRNEKRGKQVALAILGGLAAVGAAYGASHQTYTANHYGTYRGPGGFASYRSMSTLKVYDPASGILAGAAVGGITGLGLQQLEFNANTQELTAEAILQENTVDPRQMVSGQLILKDCCDASSNGNDIIRFEVATNTGTSMFEFDRSAPGQPKPVRTATAPVSRMQPAPPVPSNVIADASAKPDAAQTRTQAVPTVFSQSQTVPSVSTPTLAPVVLAIATLPKGGQDSYGAERVARTESCSVSPKAVLVAKGAGFESYSVACSNGDAMAIRCEYGTCRALR